MQNTPNANRLQIGFFGARNAGKSSLLNAIVNENTATVSKFRHNDRSRQKSHGTAEFGSGTVC